MKAEDLMIGDWVYNTHNRQNEQVAEIGSGLVMLDYNDLYEYDEIEPIPITSEILEKNGCKKYISGQYFLPQGDRNVVIFIADTRNFPNSNHIMLLAIKKVYNDVRIGVNYLHQLQHVFRMLNIEKEWKV